MERMGGGRGGGGGESMGLKGEWQGGGKEKR